MTPIDEVSSERAREWVGGGALTPRLGPRFHALSFWLAIVLPALYIPLLFAGIEDARGLLVFLGLFGLHVLALIGGRSYRESPES